MPQQLSARAKRLIRAGEALFGAGRWHTAMARATGLSQTYITIMANGARPVTDEAERVLLRTLQQERKRLKAVSAELAEINEDMLA